MENATDMLVITSRHDKQYNLNHQIGAFVAAIAAACGANLVIQIILFVVVSVVLLFLTRPIAVKHLNANTEKTNAEALVGAKAVVLEEINNLKETGKAKVNGMEWTARAKSDDEIIPVDSMVTITEISGVKLIVEKVADAVSES